MDFGSILRKSCRVYQHNVAVTFEQQHQTYAQLWERACRLANALRDLGLEPGDRVAVLGDNQLETIEQAAGLALAGLVRCPMYVQNPPESHVHCLNDVGARACLVQKAYVPDVVAIRDRVPDLKHLIGVGSTEGVDLNYEQMLAAASPVDSHDVTLGEDDDHIIRFSAGTTGRPKGILHSVRGWREMGNEFALVLPRMRDTDAYLVAAPLSHAAGLLLWPLIAHGCRHVIMPAFHPGRFLDLVESERCTLTFLVPTMIQMVATEPGRAPATCPACGWCSTAPRRSPNGHCARASGSGATLCIRSTGSPKRCPPPCLRRSTTSSTTASRTAATYDQPGESRRTQPWRSWTTRTWRYPAENLARSA
ncbi:class I adenylate-forming enzyme family protein [Pseudonocardia sp. T1-2H]|uniref:class I adenylate-forming enzyme family protein n=1 Tax=Pseudonocardia sp. T1-2H TaxID=3128899 RepID=UPI0031016B6A